MTEKDFEDILSKYPELIEEGLVLIGRQLHIKGKFVDLLFDDRHGQIFNVGLQKRNKLF
jgi:RecB family endonuclease NucS